MPDEVQPIQVGDRIGWVTDGKSYQGVVSGGADAEGHMVVNVEVEEGLPVAPPVQQVIHVEDVRVRGFGGIVDPKLSVAAGEDWQSRAGVVEKGGA